MSIRTAIGWFILTFLAFISVVLIVLGGIGGFKPEAEAVGSLLVVLAIVGAVMVLVDKR